MTGLRFPDGTPITPHDIVAWLRASLHHGTARPHRTAQGITPERRAALDAQARAERLERTGLAPGEHPAPMHLDIQDLLDEAAAGEASWPLRALSALGMLPDGQLLDALCPWCDGRTTTAPAGGARTLRVRMLADGRPAVVCEGTCEPPEHDVGAEWRGRPAWPLEAEGAWLAGRIEHADEARRLAAGQVERMTAVAGVASVCWCGSPARPGLQTCGPEHCRVAAQRSRRERRRAGRGAEGTAA
jgi:hypothetical protein